MCKNYWEHLVVYPSKTYTIPTGAAGKQFIKELAQLLEEIAFQMVIFQRVSGVNRSRDIKRTIE
jgi:hypothetical protein